MLEEAHWYSYSILLFRTMEMRLVTRQPPNFFRHVRQLGFEFLYAQNVRILLLKPLEKAFLQGGTDAVRIKCDDPHHLSDVPAPGVRYILGLSIVLFTFPPLPASCLS